MGSFRGHALPGTFFFLFGLAHAVSTLRRYFRYRFNPRGEPYVSRASLNYRRFPIEAVLNLVATTIG